MGQVVLKPMQWSNTVHIDDVEPLNDEDEKVLSEVQEVLKRNGALKRFGMCLIHKHFELNDNEFMLEETDEENREQKISVQRSDNPDQNAIQTQWQFDENGIESATKCVLRCNYNSGHKLVHVREGS